MVETGGPTAVGHLNGLDYLRAAAALAVVVWHMSVVPVSTLFDVDRWAQHRVAWNDALVVHFLLLAVPLFMLMSAYLLVVRPPTTGIRARIVTLLTMAVFWSVVLKLWQGGSGALRAGRPDSVGSALEFVVRAGNTPYYFFVSLSLVLLLVWRLRGVAAGWSVALLVVATTWLAIAPAIASRWDQEWAAAYWNPLNFVVYAPIAVLVERAPRPRPWMLLLLAAAAVPVAALEWIADRSAVHFAGNGFAFPGYTRPSSAILVTLLLLLALPVRRQPGRLVRVLAINSLAIYVLHLLVFPEVFRITGLDGTPGARAAAAALTVAACLAIAAVLRPALQRRLI
ncbi:MAG: acyltransferase family protein [Microthrixaceae bacterium]